MELKPNGTCQCLAYAANVTLLGNNIDTTKNTETFIDVSKVVCPEIGVMKTICCYHCTRLQVKIGTKNLSSFKNLGLIFFVIFATIDSRTICLLICCQENITIKIFNTMVFPVALYLCETWSLILRGMYTYYVREQAAEESI
jgi:hypothetical protein